MFDSIKTSTVFIDVAIVRDSVQVLWLFYSESSDCRKAVACKECKYPPCELKDTSELCHTDPALWVPGGDIKVCKQVTISKLMPFPVGRLSDHISTLFQQGV